MFDAALEFVLKFEGGFSDHPADPGGATNLGVTQKTYDTWRESRGVATRSVRWLTHDEAKAIYRERYWVPIGADAMSPPLALMAFDASVNQGVGRARELLERSGRDWRVMAALRLEHYCSLSIFATFGRGWTRRLAACVRACAALPELRQVVVLHELSREDAASVFGAVANSQPAILRGHFAMNDRAPKLDLRRT